MIAKMVNMEKVFAALFGSYMRGIIKPFGRYGI